MLCEMLNRVYHNNPLVLYVQMFRCALRREPSSSLTNDCITAMAEGLDSSLYNYFLVHFWQDGGSASLSEVSSSEDAEWTSFSTIIMQMGRRSGCRTQQHLNLVPSSSWQFLLESKFHKNYCKLNLPSRIYSGTSLSEQGSEPLTSKATEIVKDSFYSDLYMSTLDSLHAVYESLKLDNLRKQ